MRRSPNTLSLALTGTLLAVVLTGCFGGGSGVPERVWPPQATVQELRRLPDGDWQMTVRLRNFSTVAMHFDKLELQVSLAGQPAGAVSLQPDLRIGPGLAEPLPARFIVSDAAIGAVEQALGAGQGLRYALTGEVTSTEPRGRWPQEFNGVLTPVAGVDGVLR